MQHAQLDRVLAFRHGVPRVIRWSLAVATAAVLCGLTLAAGIAVHKLVARDAGKEITAPADLLLGGLLRGDWGLPIHQWSLGAVCGLMLILAIVLRFAWGLQSTNGQYEATEALAELHRLLYRRAVAPAAADILSTRSEAEKLLSRSGKIRKGLIVQWQQKPRCQAGAAALLGMGLWVDPWLTLLGMLLAVGGYWRYRQAFEVADERTRVLNGQAAKSESLLLEALRLAPLAASFGLDEPPGEPFERNLRLRAAAEYRGQSLQAAVGARVVGLVVISAVILFTVFCFSGRLPLSSGAVVALALSGASVLTIRLLSLRTQLATGDEAAAEVFEYLDRSYDLPQSSSPRPLEPLQQSIRLDQVTWEDHRGRRVLEDASCEIPAGQLTAVLSSDDEAPAAIAALVSRLHDPLEGRVLFDGEDIRGADLADVRREVCFVPARPLLFTGTVEDNVLCGQQDLAPRVAEAAKRCGAWEMIQALPQGLTTLVGPLGLELSAEATFLVMLTRAAIRTPSLLIVEEPMAGESVLDAVEAAAEHCAVLLIPSRIESLREAAHVLLLHQGRVHGTGSHAELIQSSDLYRHLNYMRFNPYQNGALSMDGTHSRIAADRSPVANQKH